MIPTRKLGKIFRGTATPAQLMTAAVIGALLGFMPGFFQAPGMLAFLFVAAILLNANLALIGVTALIAGLLSIPLLPVTFGIGRILLEGPTEGLFAAMVNAPVLALFGFEYYVTTGGLVVGVIFGIGFGFATIRAVRAFRRKMASLDESSESWKRFNQKWWVKTFVFIFIGGGHGKKTYQEILAERKVGLIRPLGVVCAGLAVALAVTAALFTSDQIVGYVVQSNLERANGATVDLERAELRLREGRMTLTGLAVSDPKNLRTDLFRAELLEADISHADLLRKRMHIERLRVVDASTGEDRRLPGRLTRPLPKERPSKEKPSADDAKTLEDYLQEAQKWRERLAQVAEWLERVSGPEVAEGDDPAAVEDEAARLRRLREEGYRNAVASHLLKGAPTLLISQATAERMRVKGMPDETLDVVAEHLSTHPSLVDEAPRVAVRSSEERMIFDARFASLMDREQPNTLEMVYRGLAVDSVAGGLKFSGKSPMQGGTLDLQSKGSWSLASLDLPVDVTIRNTRLSVAQAGETSIEELMVPLALSGSLRNPRVHFSDQDFADALMAAGKAELANRVRGEADKLREQAEERVGDQIRDRTRGLLDGRIPGR